MAAPLLLLLSISCAVPPALLDPMGARAAALQRMIDAASSSSSSRLIELDGIYNFSARSLLLQKCHNLTLRGTGPATTTLLFAADTGEDIDPGVNATNCTDSALSQLSIDYSPKPKTCMCFSRKVDGKPPYPSWRPAPEPGCPPASRGITLHFQSCARMLVEDVTLHAAPFMAVTSFNGEGGHVLRRLRFAPNTAGQVWVSGKDAIHESDVRRGMTVEDSEIGYVNDDFFNFHSTLLVVFRCNATTDSSSSSSSSMTSCLVINPHIEYDHYSHGGRDTLYATNSLLEGARAGDALTFVPMATAAAAAAAAASPYYQRRLASGVLTALPQRIDDPTILQAAAAFAKQTAVEQPNHTLPFVQGGNVDVWRIEVSLSGAGEQKLASSSSRYGVSKSSISRFITCIMRAFVLLLVIPCAVIHSSSSSSS